MPNRSMNLPFRAGNKGSFDTTNNYTDLIRLKLKVLFSTEPNSRIMELDYGAGLKRFIFEPNDAQTERKIRKYILDKVQKYIPEINLIEQDITVVLDEDNHIINIDLIILINGIQQTVKMRINK